MVTASELKQNVFKLLDEVLDTKMPIEIERGDQKLQIVPVEKKNKLDNLISRPDIICGDPEDLVNISWEKEVNLDLP